ncbi:MAG: class I SAM-dependent methyltransferase [Solirubrobacterales bacterium]
MAPERALEAPPLGELVALDLPLDGGDITACCATLYEHPGVRWVLGDELHPGGEATTRRALELIDLDGDDRLLDIGSGDGRSVLLAASEYGCRAVGIEYGGRAAAEARGHAIELGLQDRVEFVTGDAAALPFDDHAFDTVITECSLCVFTDKRQALGEMRRVLRPGGRLGFPTWSPCSSGSRAVFEGRWGRLPASARRLRPAPTASCSRAPGSRFSPRRIARRTR